MQRSVEPGESRVEFGAEHLAVHYRSIGLESTVEIVQRSQPIVDPVASFYHHFFGHERININHTKDHELFSSRQLAVFPQLLFAQALSLFSVLKIAYLEIDKIFKMQDRSKWQRSQKQNDAGGNRHERALEECP